MAAPEVFILLAAFTPQAPAVSALQVDSGLPVLPAFAPLVLPASDRLAHLGSVRQAHLDSDRAQASAVLDLSRVPAEFTYFPRPAARSVRDL
jgi:hypothetical protein